MEHREEKVMHNNIIVVLNMYLVKHSGVLCLWFGFCVFCFDSVADINSTLIIFTNQCVKQVHAVARDIYPSF